MLSLILHQYNQRIADVFSDYILPVFQDDKGWNVKSVRFTDETPNNEDIDRYLTRAKESLASAIPNDWCVVQYKREPVTIDDADMWREMKIRDKDLTEKEYQDVVLGFGICKIPYVIFCSSVVVGEACEVLYYQNLYKVSEESITYEGLDIDCRVMHESLESFDIVEFKGHGSITILSWTPTFYVPVLFGKPSGKLVETLVESVYTNEYNEDIDEDQGDLVYQRERWD